MVWACVGPCGTRGRSHVAVWRGHREPLVDRTPPHTILCLARPAEESPQTVPSSAAQPSAVPQPAKNGAEARSQQAASERKGAPGHPEHARTRRVSRDFSPALRSLCQTLVTADGPSLKACTTVRPLAGLSGAVLAHAVCAVLKLTPFYLRWRPGEGAAAVCSDAGGETPPASTRQAGATPRAATDAARRVARRAQVRRLQFSRRRRQDSPHTVGAYCAWPWKSVTEAHCHGVDRA